MFFNQKWQRQWKWRRETSTLWKRCPKLSGMAQIGILWILSSCKRMTICTRRFWMNSRDHRAHTRKERPLLFSPSTLPSSSWRLLEMSWFCLWCYPTDTWEMWPISSWSTSLWLTWQVSQCDKKGLTEEAIKHDRDTFFFTRGLTRRKNQMFRQGNTQKTSFHHL